VLNEHNSMLARIGPLYATGVSLGPPESLTQTASRSLQLFSQGSPGDRQTDGPHYSVGNNTTGRSAQRRSQILLLSTATASIYRSSRLKYTMPAFPS